MESAELDPGRKLRKHLHGTLAVRLDVHTKLLKVFFYSNTGKRTFDYFHSISLASLFQAHCKVDNQFLIDFYKSILEKLSEKIIIYKKNFLTLSFFLEDPNPVQIQPEKTLEKGLLVPINLFESELLISD